MRSLRLLVAALAVAAGLVVLSPTPSYACSCVSGSAADYVTWADVVMVGTMEDRQGPPIKPVMSSADPATYTISVDRVLEGEVGPTAHVLSADSGASCGLEFIEMGNDYVVFAEQRGDELWANLCGGTGPATDEFVAEVEAVTGPPVEPDPDAPSGNAPAPATAGLAGPLALAAGASLVLLTGVLWVRVRWPL